LEDVYKIPYLRYIKNKQTMNNQILLAENKFRKKLISCEQLCEVCQKFTLEEMNEVSTFLYAAKVRLNKYLTSRPRIKYPVKKYISWLLYTDVVAFEVVRQVSQNVVEVRGLKTKQIVFPQEFYPGGFAGHFADNHNQKYEYFSDEKAPIKRIHLSSKGWGKGRWSMTDKPYMHYDYNF